MRERLQLTWLEWAAVRLLVRSNRVGLLVVKPYGSRITFISRDVTDPIDIIEHEPIAQQLERLYHQPSCDDNE